ncbi:hypothetical protein F2P81_001117 [Scophthalmus maximus]|uniref:Uncharacterized protein n=1 Tax=Scophthalmus maximus TaxID=52904 RepID=A0A6A4TWE7_SCOMX|nr:hypothetical protein F2P81_001117 [Scophthalmus maximus]
MANQAFSLMNEHFFLFLEPGAKPEVTEPDKLLERSPLTTIQRLWRLRITNPGPLGHQQDQLLADTKFNTRFFNFTTSPLSPLIHIHTDRLHSAASHPMNNVIRTVPVFLKNLPRLFGEFQHEQVSFQCEQVSFHCEQVSFQCEQVSFQCEQVSFQCEQPGARRSGATLQANLDNGRDRCSPGCGGGLGVSLKASESKRDWVILKTLKVTTRDNSWQIYSRKWLQRHYRTPHLKTPVRPKPRQGSRPVIVRFHRYIDKERVLCWAKELRNMTYWGHNIKFYKDFSAAVTKRRAAFNQVKSLLFKKGIRFGMIYPARLRVTFNGVTLIFD